jgi:hypothetical protein
VLKDIRADLMAEVQSLKDRIGNGEGECDQHPTSTLVQENDEDLSMEERDWSLNDDVADDQAEEDGDL